MVMQLFLFGELASLALKDGKIYGESMVRCTGRWKHLQNAIPYLETVIGSRAWSETAIIATNIFRGMGLRDVTLTEDERNVA